MFSSDQVVIKLYLQMYVYIISVTCLRGLYM